jgi:outer membrane protein TolC
LVAWLQGAGVAAQTPAPTERVTFDEAIRRAVEKNPSAAIAAAGILRAEALLSEARSASRVQVNGNVTTTTLNSGVEFQGSTVTPRNQLNASLDVRLPLYAPARWARTAQAADAKRVAEASADEVRRQTTLATADTYLTVIARRRVVEANTRARDVATAHFDFARELQQRGAGSRLNELRAQQEVSLDEGLVESSRLALYRAQEALGVLLVADGPVDVSDEPLFAIPPDVDAAFVGSPERLALLGPGGARGFQPSDPGSPERLALLGPDGARGFPASARLESSSELRGLAETPEAQRRQPSDAGSPERLALQSAAQAPPLLGRTDLKLFATEQQAAERALSDSSKDRLPYLEGVFQPSTTYPSQFFLPQNSWRFLMQLSVPLFDSGQREGQRLERQSAVDVSRATFARALVAARSELRAAREAVASAERGLASARAAADQAQQVVDIVNISFRAGAATNIEVIDAEGRARDADTAVGVAEDTVRRARLELLTSVGRFP